VAALARQLDRGRHVEVQLNIIAKRVLGFRTSEDTMQLVLTEDQELLAKTAADFVAQNSPGRARARAARRERSRRLLARALEADGELGWVGIPFPESLGGAGMGLAELAVVLEELGRNLAPEPFLSTVLLAGGVLQLAGSEAQQKRWLEPAVQGDAFLALAQQERASRFDLHRVATRAEAAGGGYRLTGEKIAVLDGAAADALIVVARTRRRRTTAAASACSSCPRPRPGCRSSASRASTRAAPRSCTSTAARSARTR
jgi:alkylation response protein AidB-like acyl-CoA dehydrogenase